MYSGAEMIKMNRYGYTSTRVDENCDTIYVGWISPMPKKSSTKNFHLTLGAAGKMVTAKTVKTLEKKMRREVEYLNARCEKALCP
jgi:hypothetical protein